MVLKIYTVYDSKTQAYLPPMFMRSKGEAVRSFEAAANDPQSTLCKYPADFTLFEIGEFDDQTGTLSMYEAKISLGVAVEFKQKPEASAPLLEAINGQKEGQ